MRCLRPALPCVAPLPTPPNLCRGCLTAHAAHRTTVLRGNADDTPLLRPAHNSPPQALPTTASRCIPATKTGSRPGLVRPRFPDAPMQARRLALQKADAPRKADPHPRGVPCSSIPARATPATPRNLKRKRACCGGPLCRAKSAPLFSISEKFLRQTRPGPIALPPSCRQP